MVCSTASCVDLIAAYLYLSASGFDSSTTVDVTTAVNPNAVKSNHALPLIASTTCRDRVSGEESTPPPSRLSRISGRVRKMIRKAIMGYIPEEEVSYKERAAQQAAAAAKLRGEPEVS